MEDRDIVELYRNKDQRAIDETDKKYGKYLFKIAINILGNKDDADECLNDTYMSAWNSIPIKENIELKYYLVRIIKNKALNVVTKNSAGKRGCKNYTQIVEELEDIASSTDDPENRLLKQLEERQIEHFLDSLEKKERQIFVRRYWFCEKSAEIAKRYEMSVVAVNLKLHRTRKKFKSYMLVHGYE